MPGVPLFNLSNDHCLETSDLVTMLIAKDVEHVAGGMNP